jgi:hypothetical protein
MDFFGIIIIIIVVCRRSVGGDVHCHQFFPNRGLPCFDQSGQSQLVGRLGISLLSNGRPRTQIDAQQGFSSHHGIRKYIILSYCVSIICMYTYITKTRSREQDVWNVVSSSYHIFSPRRADIHMILLLLLYLYMMMMMMVFYVSLYYNSR